MKSFSLGSALLVLGAVACLTLGCSAPSDEPEADEAVGALRGVTERIRLVGTDLCVDRAYGGVDPTTEVILWKCHQHDNQRWSRRFRTIVFETRMATVMPEVTTRCLTMGMPSQPVEIMPCHLLSTQWTYADRTLSSGSKCLSAERAASSARIVARDCDGSALQRWELID